MVDEKALVEITEDAWKTCLATLNEQQIQFDRKPFNEFHPGIQRRLIRKAMSSLRPDFQELSYSQVIMALDYFQDPSLKATNWVGRINLANSADCISFIPWESEIDTTLYP